MIHEIPRPNRSVHSLRRRARRLRSDAETQLFPVASAYKRRASELELEARLLEERHALTPA